MEPHLIHPGNSPQSILLVLFWVVCWLVPIALFSIVCYIAISLPLRQQEKTRFFLDLLETALERGGSVEKTLIAMARSGDRVINAGFHQLATRLEQGLRLDQALEKTPSFLPSKIVAMIHAGTRVGDLRKVLPACRQLAGDALSHTRGSVQYLTWFGFVSLPLVLLMSRVVIFMVVPWFRQISVDLSGMMSPSLTFLGEYGSVLLGILAVLAAGLWLGSAFFGFETRPHSALSRPLNRAAYRTPWKRKRMQRDFVTMLSVLLDSEMPEIDAVEVAAACTANETFQRKAREVVARLRQGVPLTAAVQVLDDSGEFRWRLKNAAIPQGGFMRSLAGWRESLDAAAYQQEQTAALAVTSVVILINGAFVCLVAIAMFSTLTGIIDAGLLW